MTLFAPLSKLPIELRQAGSSQYSGTMKHILDIALVCLIRKHPLLYKCCFPISILEIGSCTTAQIIAFDKRMRTMSERA